MPMETSLLPHSKRKLFTLNLIDPEKTAEYQLSVLSLFGVSNPEPDYNYLYSCPIWRLGAKACYSRGRGSIDSPGEGLLCL